MVNTDMDLTDPSDGLTSLREAIAETNVMTGADRIVFDFGKDDPATILLRHGELRITDDLTIDGPGATILTVDASGNDPTPNEANGDGSRIFDIDDGSHVVDRLVAINGLRLTGADARENGGAIHSREVLSLVSSIVTGNSSLGVGGGISTNANSSSRDLFVKSSIVEANRSAHAGGGISAHLINVIASKITGNTVASDVFGAGGGVYTKGGTINGSVIAGNVASGFGGGIYMGYPGQISITETVISGNHAGSYGGGIAVSSFGAAQIIGSTVTGNVAHDCGGGIHAIDGPFGAALEISNSIVAGNRDSGEAPDLSTSHFLGVFMTHRYRFSLVGNNTGTGLTESPLGTPDSNGNLIGGPINGVIDPQLGPLADNGGFLLPDGSLIQSHSLLPGSPALDAGDPTIHPQLDAYDQRGAPFLRVADGNLGPSIAIDIGAYEAQRPPSADFNANQTMDGSDLLAWQRGFGATSGAVRSDGNSDDDQDVDASDLAAWMSGFGDIGYIASATGASDHVLGEPLPADSSTREPTKGRRADTDSSISKARRELDGDVPVRADFRPLIHTSYRIIASPTSVGAKVPCRIKTDLLSIFELATTLDLAFVDQIV